MRYRPLLSAPEVQEPPLKNYVDHIRQFNQSRKITPRTASNWMAVLNAVPNSKLLLKSKNLEEVERQQSLPVPELGLAAERLELRGHSPSVEASLRWKWTQR